MPDNNSTFEYCVVFNVRLDSSYRLSRLIKLLQKLSLNSEAYFSIRIRGGYAVLAYEQIVSLFKSNSNSNYRVYLGEDFKQWKMNTFVQVIESNCDRFLLLQEDHYLTSSLEELNFYIKECFDKKIDIGYITAWFTYKEFRDQANILGGFHSGRNGSYGVLDRIPWDFLDIEKPRYLVPLVAYFERDFLDRILLSPRPFWRKYPANSPFDFEQSPWAEWLLPINIGFSSKELFACIDDDIGIPGTSLQSRTLYPLDNIRKGEHHATAPIGIQKNIKFFKNCLPFNIHSDSIFESLKNEKNKVAWIKISKLLYYISKNIDAVTYSIHNLLNYLFNVPEIHYKLMYQLDKYKKRSNQSAH